MAEVRDRMAALFAASDYQSILFVVSQYWNDSASDELHTRLVASRRSTPLWPHRCSYELEPIYDDDGNELPDPTIDDGEACNWCADQVGYLDIGSMAQTRAFETYCREHSHQEMSMGEAYLPYAIGRRRANGGVDLEIVGVPQRPRLEIVPEPKSALSSVRSLMRSLPKPTWLDDPRARSLYDLVCGNPRDTSARRVLGDYLLEREHPHGELIALSLADSLDDDGRARLAALLADHGRRWLGPLVELIPYESARFEGGFLAHALVAATPDTEKAARGHAAWGTVETIELALDSEPVLHSSMVALREVGMLRSGHDRDRLFGADRPWAIERLRIEVPDDRTVQALATTSLLPKLRELVVAGKHRFDCVERLRCPKLVVVAAGEWRPSPEVMAGDRRIGIVDERDGDRTGWELTFSHGRVAVTMVGWGPESTLRRLDDLLEGVPAHIAVELVPSAYFAPVASDIERLGGGVKRNVSIRA